ncbi:MAG TPA: helix-turn-helix domain-containing protein [Ruminiclostridium sp.]
MKKINTHSVFGQFLVTYIFILIVPLIIGWIAVNYSGKVVENEIYSLNTNILRLVSTELDKNIRQMKELTSEMSINSRMNGLSYAQNPLTVENRIEMYKMINDFDVFLSKYDFISEFYLYFKGSDMIVNSTGAFEPELFYDNFIRSSGISYQQWHALISENNSKGVITDDSKDFYIRQNYDYILFRQTIMEQNKYGNYVNAFVFVDKDMIRDTISKVVWNDKSGIFIIDGQKKIITSNLDIKMFPDMGEIKPQGWSKITDHKEIYAASTASSMVFDWKYIFIVPLGTLMKELINFKTIMTSAFWIIMGIGVFLSVIMAKKSYRPVKQIVMTLKHSFVTNQQISDKADNVENEFSYIFKTVESNFEKVSQINVKLKQQQGELRSAFIADLITGHLPDVNMAKKTADYYNIDLSNEYFTVLICNLDFESTINAIDIPELENYVSTFLPDRSHCYITSISAVKYLILVTTTIIIDNLSYFQIGAKLTEYLDKANSTSCTLAVGTSYGSPDKIGKSYNQASRCLEYKFLKNSEQTILYNEINETAVRYFYPENIENHLICNIKREESEEVVKTVKGLFYENVEVRKLSPEMIKIFLLNLMKTLLKAEEELKKTGKTIHISKFFDLDYTISSSATIKSIEAEFLQIFEEICFHSQADNLEQVFSSWRVQKVVDYINTNFAEYDLNVSMLAEKFNVTIQHLSSAFKIQVGENMLTYIHKVRIEKAKELLRTTNMTIDNIAKAVGCGNYLSLVRSFKKYEGVTPGIYRTELGK